MTDELNPPLTEAEENALFTLYAAHVKWWNGKHESDATATDAAEAAAVRLIRAAERERAEKDEREKVLREVEGNLRGMARFEVTNGFAHHANALRRAADAIAAMRGTGGTDE